MSQQVSLSNVFALVTMPYNNWLAGAQLSVSVAQSSVTLSLATDTVSAVLNQVQLTVVGLSSDLVCSGQWPACADSAQHTASHIQYVRLSCVSCI